MPGHKGEAGVSPALSRNCNLDARQEARSTASVMTTTLTTASRKGTGACPFNPHQHNPWQARGGVYPLPHGFAHTWKGESMEFHQMFPADEILLCGVVFLYGLLAGGLVRLVTLWRGRRTS